jgi:hypothetical protein
MWENSGGGIAAILVTTTHKTPYSGTRLVWLRPVFYQRSHT